ncbi:MAG: phage scaffolding protein [Velocimicrobium sp.]
MKEKVLQKIEGLTKEQINKIVLLSKEELECFIPKKRFDALNEKKKDLEQRINEKDEQIKILSKRNSFELQRNNQKIVKEFERKIADLTINSVLRDKLMDANYPDLLISKIDKSKLSVNEDGIVLGIEEQIARMKEVYNDMFPSIKKEGN